MEITDRYEIVDEEHGEGGFGKVSKRRDIELERLVAVKQLTMLDDKEACERFRREAKTLAKMSHPNIPAIYDVKFNDKEMFICFEFIEGTTLRGIIESGEVPPMDKARRWFTQVAAALSHAHEKGIIHRDIKPENIIISNDEANATIVDFGIALTADDLASLTKSGYIIGTPQYMSPEQSRGDEIDSKSDVYSLGVTLYEVLAGHLPHPGGYQSLSDANESIPPAIDKLIQDAIHQEQTSRIQSMAEFIDRLRLAFRTDIPLSELLTDARLYDVVTALRRMSAEDFHAKNRGQRLLLINRLKDLMRTEDPKLNAGTAQLLAHLTNLAQFEDESDYRPVIEGSLNWGYEKPYGSKWFGDQEVRTALLETAKHVNQTGHEIISKVLIEFLDGKDISELPGWYTHDLRILLKNLLANTNCGDVAVKLAEIYDEVNIASH